MYGKRSIKIIRAAFRDIQKLPPNALMKVYEILQRLSCGDERHTKPLKGYDKLLRTRLGGKWRVIWQKENNDILVIKAGWRDSFYDDAFDRRDRINPKVIEELLQPEGKILAENPSYAWNQELDRDWYKFVYGSYRNSPQLTDYQRQVLEQPLNIICSHHQRTNSNNFEDNACVVFQSAPGTGKTVCASLFACEIHRAYEWNTMLVVPSALSRDIEGYADVKLALESNNFWLGTFPQWLGKIHPEIQSQLASPQQEFAALQQAIKYTRNTEVTRTDVLLYQSFVLDEGNTNQSKNAVFQANLSRINQLLKINKNHWYKALACRLSRLDAANILQKKLLKPPVEAECSIVIVDEAQDLMLCELQALIAVCKSWIEQGHQTYLWLLGDLNQRISPTNFTWNQLKVRNIIELKRNYRNSQQILVFANQFCELAQKINSSVGAKKLPPPAQPEDAFEVGESVGLLKCADKAEALKLLKELADRSKQEKNQRHLLYDLANAIKVISHHPIDTHEINNCESLVILNAEQAKGREFETCVAFCLFEGDGMPSLEETFAWYTLLTRPRSRLLIIATTAEIERLNSLGKDYFASCKSVNAEAAIDWITEVASDMNLSQISNDVLARLLKRCETGHLYWDTYLALQFAGVRDPQLYQWEQKAISLLQKSSVEVLNAELAQAENISLRCLILRAMQYSWEAVTQANILKASDEVEHKRLIISIAKDLEAKKLPYEAARVRATLADGNYKRDFPFWQDVIESSPQSQPLVSLLCKAFNYKLQNFLENT
ncbi:MAG: hypothetical protein AAF378_15605 [Cyanobacteria bacterium P01_A01_bin.84]